MAKLDITIVPAGAGSGKTHRIETTLKEWIANNTVQPDRVVAVTFTEAAANEMRLRIRQALLRDNHIEEALALDRSYISTVHSFGTRLLRENAFAAKLSPSPRLLNDDEKDFLIRMELARELARSSELELIARDLPRFDYRYNPVAQESAEEVFRSTVGSVIDKLRSLGNRSQDPALVTNAKAWISDIYGDTVATKATARKLHAAIEALLAKFPKNMAEFAKSAAGKSAFDNDQSNLIAARDAIRLMTDWPLWQNLRGMRVKKRGDQVSNSYVELASRVTEAASILPQLDGPLKDSQNHAAALIGGIQVILKRYAETKRRLELLDYSDMVVDAETLFREHPEVCDAFACSIDCVIVDEFQDTNPIQFALLWHIISRGVRTLIVGDPKQAIMRFQGADARLMEALLDYKGIKIDPLRENWRSVPLIMNFVNVVGKGLFGKQYEALAPKLPARAGSALEAIVFSKRPQRGSGISLVTLRASHVAHRIIELLADERTAVYDKRLSAKRRIEPRDIAVLCRTNDGLEAYAVTLRDHGIKVKLDAGDWFSTDEVQILLHAASYAANTSDRHAALFLATSPLGRIPLEAALKSLVNDEPINLPLLARLSALAPSLKPLTLDTQIIRLIAELELYSWALTTSDPTQARANIVKFEASAREFGTAHRDTLAAAGIHGYGIKTFLAWLRHRAETPDLDGQPTTGDDADAVELVTWHSSKGREWPIVVVTQLDNGIEPRLPNQSIGYKGFKDIGEILAVADLRYAPNFAAPEQNANFKEALNPDEQNDARRLLYVVLSRARETLILEWPDYALSGKDTDEIKPSYARLLHVDCGLKIDAAGASCKGNKLPMRLTRITTGELAETIDDGASKPVRREGIGRVAIRRAPIVLPTRPDTISPSLLIQSAEPTATKEIAVHRYAEPIVVPAGLYSDAAEQGTVLHHCVRTLLLRPDLSEALFASVGVSLPEETKTAIKQSASGLRALLDRLGITIIGTEVSILAKRPDGAVMNGLIDLLGRSSKGLFVLDHKSDLIEDPIASASTYFPQLSAYFKGLTSVDSNAGSVDVAINWLSLGAIALFDRSCF
jgi:ATP-dependent helicase/nuclease subunit A